MSEPLAIVYGRHTNPITVNQTLNKRIIFSILFFSLIQPLLSKGTILLRLNNLYFS